MGTEALKLMMKKLSHWQQGLPPYPGPERLAGCAVGPEAKQRQGWFVLGRSGDFKLYLVYQVVFPLGFPVGRTWGGCSALVGVSLVTLIFGIFNILEFILKNENETSF